VPGTPKLANGKKKGLISKGYCPVWVDFYFDIGQSDELKPLPGSLDNDHARPKENQHCSVLQKDFSLDWNFFLLPTFFFS
jgi:hypothetical protein